MPSPLQLALSALEFSDIIVSCAGTARAERAQLIKNGRNRSCRQSRLLSGSFAYIEYSILDWNLQDFVSRLFLAIRSR